MNNYSAKEAPQSIGKMEKEYNPKIVKSFNAPFKKCKTKILSVECGPAPEWRVEGYLGQKGHWSFKYLTRTVQWPE